MAKQKIVKGGVPTTPDDNTLYLSETNHDSNELVLTMNAGGKTLRSVNPDDHQPILDQIMDPIGDPSFSENFLLHAGNGGFTNKWRVYDNNGNWASGSPPNPSDIILTVSNTTWDVPYAFDYYNNTFDKPNPTFDLDQNVLDLIAKMGNRNTNRGPAFAIWRGITTSGTPGTYDSCGYFQNIHSPSQHLYLAYYLRAVTQDVQALATRIDDVHTNNLNAKLDRLRLPSYVTVTPSDGWVRIEIMKDRSLGYDYIPVARTDPGAEVLMALPYQGTGTRIPTHLHTSVIY